MFHEKDCGYPSLVILRYQIISAKLCFFYEAIMNFAIIRVPSCFLPC